MKLQTNPLIDEEPVEQEVEPEVEPEAGPEAELEEEHVRSRTVSKSGSESGSDVTEGPDELSSEYDDLCDEEIAKEADFANDFAAKMPENDETPIADTPVTPVTNVTNEDIENGIDSPQTNVELGHDDDHRDVLAETSDDVLVGPDSQSEAVKGEPEQVSQSDVPSEEKTPSSELIVTENPMAAVSAECYDVYTHETFEDDSEIESSQIVPEPIAAVVERPTEQATIPEETPAIETADEPAVKPTENESEDVEEAAELQESVEIEKEPEVEKEADIEDKPVAIEAETEVEPTVATETVTVEAEPEILESEIIAPEGQTEDLEDKEDPVKNLEIDENESVDKSIESQVQEIDNTETEIDTASEIEQNMNDKVNEKESQEIENEGSKADSNNTASADYETVAEANSNVPEEPTGEPAAGTAEESPGDVQENEEIAAIITAPDYVEGGCTSRDIGVTDAESDFVVFGNNKIISDTDLVQPQDLVVDSVNEATGGAQAGEYPTETADIPSEPIIAPSDAETGSQRDGEEVPSDACDGNDQPNGISVEQNTIEQALEEIVIATEGADDTDVAPEDQPEEVVEEDEASVNEDPVSSVHENNIDQNHGGETIEHVNDINAEATENDISSAALDESLVGGLDHSRAYDPTIVSDASEVDDLTDDAAEGKDYIFHRKYYFRVTLAYSKG